MDCQLCDEPIDRHLRLATDPVALHRQCALRSVIGGIGHLIAHDYWCVQRHDPDAGLTYRQSALLVDDNAGGTGVNSLMSVRQPRSIVSTSMPARAAASVPTTATYWAVGEAAGARNVARDAVERCEVELAIAIDAALAAGFTHSQIAPFAQVVRLDAYDDAWWDK